MKRKPESISFDVQVTHDLFVDYRRNAGVFNTVTSGALFGATYTFR